MKDTDAGTVVGCLIIAGLFLLKGLAVAAVVYVAVHFITKYW